eukprot:TRINITY_DN63101_c0_g1_i1.p1 TRINITY_DN63101_c0_g1~~TRINITY_DN63101_c0_g1_i1.p1  ORF type:complete len:230 (+),score=44.88 TRINITY_DN63101_c0_g1_i1:72-761(+)
MPSDSESEDKKETREKRESRSEKDKEKDRDRSRDRDRDRRGDGERPRAGPGALGAMRTFTGAVQASVASTSRVEGRSEREREGRAPESRPGPYDSAAKGKGRGPPPRKALDRSRICPFLLRIFRKIGGHHGIEAFAERGKEPVDEELQVYAWPDVTLRELADLIKDVAPEARNPNARLSFNLIYPDKTGKNVSTAIGTVTYTRRGPDDDKALSSTKFQTGDLLDLAILK